MKVPCRVRMMMMMAHMDDFNRVYDDSLMVMVLAALEQLILVK